MEFIGTNLIQVIRCVIVSDGRYLMGITGGVGDKTGPINLTDFPMLTTRREDGRVKQTVRLTDLISGDFQCAG